MDYYKFFVDFATPIVGTVAAGAGYFVYWKAKKDEKREAAVLIYLEILNAEKGIDVLKRDNVKPDNDPPIMPFNNWSGNKHLFVDILDSNDYNLINNFYFDCHQIDKSISMLSVSKQLEFKENAIHSMLSQMAEKAEGKKEIFEEIKKKFLELIEKDIYFFPPQSATDIINQSKVNFQPISQLGAGQKIKRIAKLK